MFSKYKKASDTPDAVKAAPEAPAELKPVSDESTVTARRKPMPTKPGEAAPMDRERKRKLRDRK